MYWTAEFGVIKFDVEKIIINEGFFKETEKLFF